MKKVIIVLLIIIGVYEVKSQNKIENLKKEREKIENDIIESEKILNQIQKNKYESENYLKILNENINAREKKIEILNKEIENIDNEIKKLDYEINVQKENLEKIIKNYFKIINKVSKNRIEENILLYILASKSFNEAYKRMIILKKLNEKIKNKKIEIKRNINNIEEIKNELNKKKYEKSILIKEIKVEIEKNEIKKEEINGIIKNLIGKEEELRKKVDKRKKELEKINNEIKKLIVEEVKKKEKEGFIIKSEFELNKGKLDWPVKNGFIINRYGLQKHNVLKNVTFKNNGIDISVSENSYAYSIFDGVVKKIFIIPGYNLGIIINHGDYYTVYMNMEKIYVKEGQKIKLNQEIGKIYTEKETNETILHFQIWKNMENLNPEEWLKKKN